MTDFVRPHWARAWTLGLTVVLLYALFVTAVFSGFATYIYRSEWQAALSAGDEIDDIDNLIYTIRRERLLETAIAQSRREAHVIRDEEAEHVVERDRAFGQIAAIELEREKLAYFELAAARDVDETLAPADQIALDDVINDATLTVAERADAILNIFSTALPAIADEQAVPVNALVTEMQDNRKRLAARDAQHADTARAAKAELANAATRLAEIERLNENREQQLTALRGKLNLASPDRARFEALYVDVPGFGAVFQRLVSFPTIFLTLIVTIAAGGLGTVVSFSRRYYARDEQPSLARLFVNVGEGIAAALAIFLFSGAGMLALTQGAGANNTVELSPYTVAFIAFLSGFMAEEAFGAIQNAGQRIFKRDVTNPSENEQTVAS